MLLCVLLSSPDLLHSTPPGFLHKNIQISSRDEIGRNEAREPGVLTQPRFSSELIFTPEHVSMSGVLSSPGAHFPINYKFTSTRPSKDLTRTTVEEIKCEDVEPTESSTSQQWTLGTFLANTSNSRYEGVNMVHMKWGVTCSRRGEKGEVFTGAAFLPSFSKAGFTSTLPSDPLELNLRSFTAFCWKHQAMSGVSSCCPRAEHLEILGR
ncbi:hypothetical protein HF521_001004 [Silurus meridionalis]|uniref:Uncharacterized protein n=1 Tax=Silurus meridionalis TaxID=175797 RepID=A0A8T0BZI3_SILME|nr:hypothetical protein HF521_001004 [Silurus meridionalis]